MDLHGTLVVDKPRGLTSHDVVSRVRRLLRTRKVGHAGTLDPAAEGVLVIAVGRATKLLNTLSTSSKSYAAHIVLGVASDSGDIEGPARAFESPVAPPSLDLIEHAVKTFVGDIEQIPPSYSAIKVDGEPLYRKARRGETIEVTPRHVRIDAIEVLDYRFPDLFFGVTCSAGTYIRSLARDIGDRAGTGAYLHFLLRTRSGSITLSDAWPLSHLERELTPESFAWFGRNVSLNSENHGTLVIDPANVGAWYDGRSIPGARTGNWASSVHAFDHEGSWLGMGVRDGDRSGYQPRLVVRQ